MRFVEIAFTVLGTSAEPWAELLVAAGAGGVEERDPSTLERAPEGRATLVVWLPPAEVDGYLQRVAAESVRLPEAVVARRDRDEDEWRDAWKKYFGVRRMGRFVIVPSWERYQVQSGEWVIALDPGRAFGTGGHATTRLCLQAIDRFAGECRRFLDVGCGSGVLAIACALRFAKARGTGVDIDPDAIDVSRENATRNGVLDRIEFTTTPLASGEHEIVCANIQPEVLMPMAGALADRLAPGGLLVLSGILQEAAGPVEQAFAGLTLTSRQDEEGWRALAFTR